MPALSPALPVGSPVWADLASSDLEASTAFYGAVLGWTRKDFPEFDDYADFQSNGEEVGGLAPKVDEADDAWTVYLKVDDIEAAVIAAAAAGGRVLHEPSPVGGLGEWALLEDPSGAEVAIWQAGSFVGFEIVNEPGAPCWFELHTKDFAAAVPFYEKVFGWKVTSIGDSDEFRMVVFGEQGSAGAGILDAARIAADTRSQWIVYLAVADADAAASLVTANGGTVHDGPTDTPIGRMSRAADSTGAPFCFMQLPDRAETWPETTEEN
jgi:predicted enzyme related to lactoylglutathione lyase